MTYIDIILIEKLVGIVIESLGWGEVLEVNPQNSCYQKRLIYIHTIKSSALSG